MKNIFPNQSPEQCIRHVVLILGAVIICVPFASLAFTPSHSQGSPDKSGYTDSGLNDLPITNEVPDQEQAYQHGMSLKSHKKMMQDSSRTAASQKHKSIKQMEKMNDPPMSTS